MRCPFCESLSTKVIDSRSLNNNFTIRRRRKCESCERRFTTYEEVEIQMPSIIKRDGRRENFKVEKVLSGIEKACEKRPIAKNEINDIVKDVEKTLQEKYEKEVSSLKVGEIVMNHLHDLDPVAYIRFASVYRSFKDVNQFVQEIKDDEKKFIMDQ